MNDISNFLSTNRPAARDLHNNMEADILRRFRTEIPSYVGTISDACSSCGALHFLGERTQNLMNARSASYSSCCRKGQVVLPVRYDEIDYPQELASLWVGEDPSKLLISLLLGEADLR
jgi:hypothetical protein